MKTFILLIHLFTSIITIKPSHPVHLSVCNIEYVSSQNEFYISFSFFIDDMESIIKQKYNINLNLRKNNEEKNIDSYIKNYIEENFSLIFNEIDSKKTKLIYEKKVVEELSIKLYFKIKIKKDLFAVRITNKLMTELYFDQKNLVIFSYGDIQQSFIFTSDYIEDKISLD